MGVVGSMNPECGEVPRFMMEKRIASLRRSMAKEGVEACLIFCLEGRNWENVFYLSGFRGSHSALLVGQEKAILVTDARYLRQAENQTFLEITGQCSEGLVKTVKRLLASWGTRRVAIEQRRVSHALGLSLREEDSIEWTDGSSLVEKIRRKKNKTEAGLISRAAEICSAALTEILPALRSGVSEKEIAARLEFSIRMNGAESTWGDHEFIVASGLRSVLPHGTPTGKLIETGDWVTLDFGARVGGYLCDITRNIGVGKVPEKARLIHGILREAQEEAFKKVRAGVKAREVDSAARAIIEKAGFGEGFSHGLGHGLGLELHESPRVSTYSEDVLEEGDVITIEPGIYLENFGGLRVEDDCLVTERGAVWLTRSVDPEFLQVP